MAPKICVLGSVNGQLQAAFAKLEALHAKHDFALCIVTGNLFAQGQDDEQLKALLRDQIKIPIPTYFTVGTTPLPIQVVKHIEMDQEKIAANLIYLGRRHAMITPEGIRIVALGGFKEDSVVSPVPDDQHHTFHTVEDVAALEAQAKIIMDGKNPDILLTSVCPSNAYIRSPKAAELGINDAPGPDSLAIAKLCADMRPRYHLTASPRDFFFEREPFFHSKEADPKKGLEITRFVSLASWGNPAKAKHMYAFTLNCEPVMEAPEGSTVSPFHEYTSTGNGKRKAEQAGFSFSRFDNTPNDGGHRGGRHNNKHRRQRSPPPGPDRCFFCLSNPNLPTHMVCSVGDDAYLATAKGPLPEPTTFAAQGLNFPGHIIITPLSHTPTLSRATMTDGPDEAGRALREMTRFRDNLQGMVAKQSGRRLGAVTWEISRARNVHAHWQFMAAPAELVTGGQVEAGFRVLATDLNLGRFEELEFGGPDDVGHCDYLRVWIWAEVEDRDAVVGKSLFLRIDEGVRFDLQFPRKVMAKLLGLEHREVWQNVVQTEQEEKDDVAAYREAWQEWDFTTVKED